MTKILFTLAMILCLALIACAQQHPPSEEPPGETVEAPPSSSSVAAVWTLRSDISNGDSSRVTISPDGSISTVPPLSGFVTYTSQVFNGDIAVEFEVDSRKFMMLALVGEPPNPNGSGVYIQDAWLIGYPNLVNAESASTFNQPLVPGTRFKIEKRGGLVTYFINDQFWMAGNQTPLPASVRLVTYFGDGISEPLAVLRVRVTPL